METRCAKCGTAMPAERLDLGLEACKDCTNAGPLYGFMVYDEKAGGELCMTESKAHYAMATSLIDLGRDERREKVREIAGGPEEVDEQLVRTLRDELDDGEGFAGHVLIKALGT